MHGMAQAVAELTEQGSPAFEAAVPILSQLLKAEMAERRSGLWPISSRLPLPSLPHPGDWNDSFRFKNSSAQTATSKKVSRPLDQNMRPKPYIRRVTSQRKFRVSSQRKPTRFRRKLSRTRSRNACGFNSATIVERRRYPKTILDSEYRDPKTRLLQTQKPGSRP
jgi:hypothetical protein